MCEWVGRQCARACATTWRIKSMMLGAPDVGWVGCAPCADFDNAGKKKLFLLSLTVIPHERCITPSSKLSWRKSVFKTMVLVSHIKARAAELKEELQRARQRLSALQEKSRFISGTSCMRRLTMRAMGIAVADGLEAMDATFCTDSER